MAVLTLGSEAATCGTVKSDRAASDEGLDNQCM